MSRKIYPIIFLFLLYGLTRMVGILYFVPHNDEAIYTEVAQIIATDWKQHRYGTLDGRMKGEYKKPLQFWAGSLTVNLWDNPLIGMRVWSVLMGGVALLSLYGLMRRIWDAEVAWWSVALAIFSEYYLYFDSVGVTEAFLYGLGMAYLYVLYDFLDRSRWYSGVGASLLCGCLLITKTTSLLWCGMALLIPLLWMIHQQTQGQLNLRKQSLRLYSMTFVTLGIAWGFHQLVIPAEFDAVKAKFENRFVRTPQELLEFPWGAWLQQASSFGEMLYVEWHGLTLFGFMLIIGVGLGMIRTHKQQAALYGMLCLLCLASVIPLMIGVTIFRARYWGMGFYWFYAVLAIGIVWLGNLAVSRFQLVSRFREWGFRILFFLLLVGKVWVSYGPLLQWGQNDFALQETPPGWANGAGIPQLIQRVSQLEPGLLVTDPQWGHPLTALVVFQSYYPDIQIMDMDRYLDTPGLFEKVQNSGQHFYLLLDARIAGSRPWVDALLSHPQYCGTQEVIPKQYQGQTFSNSSLVLCHFKSP